VSTDVPVLIPTYVGAAQTVHGKISADTWAMAMVAGGFHLIESKGPASQRTEVRVCYGRDTLHVRFECFEDQMDSLVVRHREDHLPVWQDDSVEVFICPYSVPSKSRCHQFVVNAWGSRAYLRPELAETRDNWRATATRLRDRWIAEITIPFDTIRPLGRNDDCWRINFCRNEHPHGETSSWSAVPRRFATYGRFGRLVPPDMGFRFNTFRAKPAGLKPSGPQPKGLDRVVGLAQQPGTQCVIIPEPQEFHRRLTKAPFHIGRDTAIVIDDRAGEACARAAEELAFAVESKGGPKLRLIRSSEVESDPHALRKAIVLGETGRDALVKKLCERERVRLPRSRFGTTSHVVDVTSDRVIVGGQTAVDVYYGVQTLKQLIRTLGDASLEIPAVGIRDYPRFGFRGVHLLASGDAFAYISRLIERVLAPLKINHIVLQTDKVAWKSHPEVIDPENFMPREDVRKLIDVARRHQISVTPLVQSPGHLEWAFRDRKNLEFAEDPNQPYCYCMSNPKSYEFIFGIMDEAIELFGNPEYLHAGRDEFDMRGVVPYDGACKAVGKERLYIQDTIKIYEHLRSRGCKMMMWGDILLKPGFRELASELPRDILIGDWHYSAADEYPSVDFFRTLRFPVVGCTWDNPRNIQSFSSYASRRSVQGMMQTTWTGFESAEKVLRKYSSQVYGYILSAAWSWNSVRPDVSDLPYRPQTVFRGMWQDQRAVGEPEFASVRIGEFCNVSRRDSGRSPGWLGVGHGNDLSSLPEGLVWIGNVPYRVLPGGLRDPSVVLLGGNGMLDAFPRRVKGIEINARVKALHFLHGCAFAVDDGARVGSFAVRYEDGATDDIPLVYEQNTYAWDDQSLGLAYGFAWRGKTSHGGAVGVCDLVWVNKRPDTKVASIEFAAGATQASPFLVAVTAEL